MVDATHYAVLNVARDASTKEIEAQWKKFALKNHPDKAAQALKPGHTEAQLKAEVTKRTALLQRGQQAKDVLCDPLQRAQYDQLNPPAKNGPKPTAPGTSQQPHGGGFSNTPPSFDEAFFNQSRPQPSRPFQQKTGWAEWKEMFDDLAGVLGAGIELADALGLGETLRGFAAPPRPSPHTLAAINPWHANLGFGPRQPRTAGCSHMVDALVNLRQGAPHVFVEQEPRVGAAHYFDHVVPPGHLGLFRRGRAPVLSMPGNYPGGVLAKYTFVGTHPMTQPLSHMGLYAFEPSTRFPAAVIRLGTSVYPVKTTFAMQAGDADLDVFDTEANDMERVGNTSLAWSRPAYFNNIDRGVYAKFYKVAPNAALMVSDAEGQRAVLRGGLHVVTSPMLRVHGPWALQSP